MIIDELIMSNYKICKEWETLRVENTVTCTDPLYDKSVTARIDDIPMKPGDYTCKYATIETDWGKRIAVMGIYHNNSRAINYTEMDGEVDVDSATAGIFVRKEDLNTEAKYNEYINIIEDEKAKYPFHRVVNIDTVYGFVCTSGFGDGGYCAYLGTNADGENVALEITFLDLDEDWSKTSKKKEEESPMVKNEDLIYTGHTIAKMQRENYLKYREEKHIDEKATKVAVALIDFIKEYIEDNFFKNWGAWKWEDVFAKADVYWKGAPSLEKKLITEKVCDILINKAFLVIMTKTLPKDFERYSYDEVMQLKSTYTSSYPEFIIVKWGI